MGRYGSVCGCSWTQTWGDMARCVALAGYGHGEIWLGVWL